MTTPRLLQLVLPALFYNSKIYCNVQQISMFFSYSFLYMKNLRGNKYINVSTLEYTSYFHSVQNILDDILLLK